VKILNIYYTKEGEFLGGKKDSKKIYLTTQTEYNKAKEKGKWSLINLEENLIKEKERIMPHSEFQDLAGTLYAESTADEFSFEEIISICCVLNNRTTMDKTTILEKATQENQVYGWKDRDKQWKCDIWSKKGHKGCNIHIKEYKHRDNGKGNKPCTGQDKAGGRCSEAG